MIRQTQHNRGRDVIRTEQIDDQVPLHNTLLHITENNDRRSNLSNTKVLHRRSKRIIRIRRPRFNLPKDLAIRQHLRRHNLLGPIPLRRIKHRLIEDVVIPKQRVGAAQAGVVLEHVVLVQVVEGEEGGVGLWVRDDGLLPHELAQRSVEVEPVFQSVDGVELCDVAAVAREEAVVRERVHHGAGAADWTGCGLVVWM